MREKTFTIDLTQSDEAIEAQMDAMFKEMGIDPDQEEESPE